MRSQWQRIHQEQTRLRRWSIHPNNSEAKNLLERTWQSIHKMEGPSRPEVPTWWGRPKRPRRQSIWPSSNGRNNKEARETIAKMSMKHIHAWYRKKWLPREQRKMGGCSALSVPLGRTSISTNANNVGNTQVGLLRWDFLDKHELRRRL